MALSRVVDNLNHTARVTIEAVELFVLLVLLLCGCDCLAHRAPQKAAVGTKPAMFPQFVDVFQSCAARFFSLLKGAWGIIGVKHRVFAVCIKPSSAMHTKPERLTMDGCFRSCLV